jgi:hypothetical protein
MGDIWLPGHPPAYTDWSYCVGVLELQGMDKGNAEILAAIAGPESGYDYTVINDTPATGDYSVGLWQINYYDGDYAPRVAEFGTPLQLIEGGPVKQAHAAYTVWRQQGWNAWFNTYTSGDWRQYIGSGPVPQSGQPPGGGPGHQPPVFPEPKIIDHYIIGLRQYEKQLIWAINKADRTAIHGLVP